MTRISVPRIAGPAIGVGTTLAFWELIGRSGAFGEVWPPFTGVLQSALVESSGREVLLHATAATVPQAARGLAAGVAVGSLLALFGALAPVLARGLGQLAVLVQAVPVIAVAPVLLTTVDRGAIPSTLAAVGASFASFVSVNAGLPPRQRSTVTCSVSSAPTGSLACATWKVRRVSPFSSGDSGLPSRGQWSAPLSVSGSRPAAASGSSWCRPCAAATWRCCWGRRSWLRSSAWPRTAGWPSSSGSAGGS